jgi:hypothetical protein
VGRISCNMQVPRCANPKSRHYGLTRGLSDLKACSPEEPNCDDLTPQLVRYSGYKHLQEDEHDIISCIGPRGLPMNESDDDAIWAYNGKAHGEFFAVQTG